MSNPNDPIFDVIDAEAEARAVADAERAIAEGRVISHDAMRRWLLSWGQPDEHPPPTCGE